MSYSAIPNITDQEMLANIAKNRSSMSAPVNANNIPVEQIAEAPKKGFGEFLLNNQTVVLIVAILIVCIIILFVYYYWFKPENKPKQQPMTGPPLQYHPQMPYQHMQHPPPNMPPTKFNPPPPEKQPEKSAMKKPKFENVPKTEVVEEKEEYDNGEELSPVEKKVIYDNEYKKKNGDGMDELREYMSVGLQEDMEKEKSDQEN